MRNIAEESSDEDGGVSLFGLVLSGLSRNFSSEGSEPINSGSAKILVDTLRSQSRYQIFFFIVTHSPAIHDIDIIHYICNQMPRGEWMEDKRSWSIDRFVNIVNMYSLHRTKLIQSYGN